MKIQPFHQKKLDHLVLSIWIRYQINWIISEVQVIEKKKIVSNKLLAPLRSGIGTVLGFFVIHFQFRTICPACSLGCSVCLNMKYLTYIFETYFGFLYFFDLGGSKTTRIARSKTSFRPVCSSAEHSR